eukprot:TRINITY_DN5304_c0_g1_i1.p1 TRINITY_DN5304_c0_g1~~TRINITY_DN5304_c0_g1_i1.p1  ORF type:complete len:1096 (-),score=228.13 TRINITY_DN5304_c0_g1_i1:192-3479(-)
MVAEGNYYDRSRLQESYEIKDKLLWMTDKGRFSAEAAEFVPGNAGFAGTAGATPKLSRELSRGAAEFVPSGGGLGQTTPANWGWNTQAPAFTPDAISSNHGWGGGVSPSANGWGQTNGYADGHYNTWQGGSRDGMRSAGTAAGGFFPQGAGGAAMGSQGCQFNMDAYSTDSSDRSSESSDSDEEDLGAPEAGKDEEKLQSAPDTHAEVAPVAEQEKLQSAPDTHAEVAPVAEQERLLSAPDTHAEVAPVAEQAEEIAENRCMEVARPEGPTDAADDSFATASARSVPSTPNGPASSPSTPTLRPAAFPSLPARTPRRAMSDSEGEWSEDLCAGHAPQEDKQRDIMEELSERTIKQWMRRFENEGDEEDLSYQFSFWASGRAAADQVLSCLLASGLEDCRIATTVEAILKILMGSNRLGKDVLESSLSEWGEDEIADVELDNPRARDFVKALEAILGDSSYPATVSFQPARAADSKATDLLAASDSTVDARYGQDLMLAMRRAVAAAESAGLIEETEPPRPKWSTQAAPQQEVPAWFQRLTSAIPSYKEARGARSGGGESTRSRNRKGKSEKESAFLSRAEPAKKLEVSDSSWQAQVAKRKADKGDEDDMFISNMRSALNKITVEKFDALSDQIIVLVSKCNRPNHGIPLLMQLVFEKATTQHHFINMYVNLCVKLHKWLTENDRIVANESQSNFKRILLNQCQSSFEQYLEPPDGFEGLTGDDLYEAQVKYKTKMLGNIRLVGELIRHGMLAPKIAIAVGAELARDDPAVRSERLETLATFLETVGLALDDPGWKHHAELESIFQEVTRSCADDTVPRRVRCLLQDVLELRSSGWKSKRRKDLSKETPLTLAQVHQKAKTEKNAVFAAPAKRETGVASIRAAMSRRAEPPPAQVLSSPSPSAGSMRNGKHSPLDSSSSAKERLSFLADTVKSAAPSLATPATPSSPKEQLDNFHREIALTLRKLGNGFDVASAARHLIPFRPPTENMLVEVVELLARIVDEPRERRQQLFPLLSALVAAGVLDDVLGQAIENFTCDAFADPAAVDPPDLSEIVLREMLPALGLSPGSLNLPPHLEGCDALHTLAEHMDDECGERG